MRTLISVVTVIDDKGTTVFQRGQVHFIGSQQIDQLNRARYRTSQNAVTISPLVARDKSDIQRPNAAGRCVQNVKAVPVFFNHAAHIGNFLCCGQNCSAIFTRKRPLPHDDHRVLSRFQNFCKRMTAIGDFAQSLRASPQIVAVIGCFDLFAYGRNLHCTGQPPLANAGINNRGFPPNIGPHDQQRISLFNPGNGGVKNVTSTHACV